MYKSIFCAQLLNDNYIFHLIAQFSKRKDYFCCRAIRSTITTGLMQCIKNDMKCSYVKSETLLSSNAVIWKLYALFNTRQFLLLLILIFLYPWGLNEKFKCEITGRDITESLLTTSINWAAYSLNLNCPCRISCLHSQ